MWSFEVKKVLKTGWRSIVEEPWDGGCFIKRKKIHRLIDRWIYQCIHMYIRAYIHAYMFIL